MRSSIDGSLRCAAGNQSLARRLGAGIDLNQGRATNIRTAGDRLFIELGEGAVDGPYDFAVVAVPSVAMEKITIDSKPFPYRAIAHGPAVKYLSASNAGSGFRKESRRAGMSDQLGMIWEGTDNQMDTARFDVSVFAGGRPAQQRHRRGRRPILLCASAQRTPSALRSVHHEFENWPKRIGMGYSHPRGRRSDDKAESVRRPDRRPHRRRRRAHITSMVRLHEERLSQASWRWRASQTSPVSRSRPSTENFHAV